MPGVTPVETVGSPEVGAVVVGHDPDLTSVAAEAHRVLSSFTVPMVSLPLGDRDDIPQLASDKPDVQAMHRQLIEHGLRTVRLRFRRPE